MHQKPELNVSSSKHRESTFKFDLKSSVDKVHDGSFELKREPSLQSLNQKDGKPEGAPIKLSLVERLRESVKSKITSNLSVLKFENDYLTSMTKRDPELLTRYMDDNIILVRFEKKYQPQQVIGEVSMNLSGARSSAVVAYTELHLFCIDQKGYEQVFASLLDDVKEKMKFFMNNFKEMNQAVLRRVCFLFEEIRFPVGETIFKEGANTDGLYFIKSGEVHVS